MKYIWHDVVIVNGVAHAEVFPISGKYDICDGNVYYQIDDFLNAVSKKYNVGIDDITTYMMDNADFDPKTVDFGAEDCGCYIDGILQ